MVSTVFIGLLVTGIRFLFSGLLLRFLVCAVCWVCFYYLFLRLSDKLLKYNMQALIKQNLLRPFVVSP